MNMPAICEKPVDLYPGFISTNCELTIKNLHQVSTMITKIFMIKFQIFEYHVCSLATLRLKKLKY